MIKSETRPSPAACPGHRYVPPPRGIARLLMHSLTDKHHSQHLQKQHRLRCIRLHFKLRICQLYIDMTECSRFVRKRLGRFNATQRPRRWRGHFCRCGMRRAPPAPPVTITTVPGDICLVFFRMQKQK